MSDQRGDAPSEAPTEEHTKLFETLHQQRDELVEDERGTIRGKSARWIDPPLPTLHMSYIDDSADMRLLQTLGEGGMGKVVAAQQVALRREVAVKMPRANHPTASAELLREALATGRLEHPHIVPVHLLGRSPEGELAFVMKRIEGVPWSMVLRDRKTAPGFFKDFTDPLELDLHVFLKVCEAMQYAHSRGILHRDLKPSNVMLGSFGEVYVVDWGLAVSFAEDDSTIPHVKDIECISGTPAYMAPEMVGLDRDDISPRTDIYLLGAVLYHLATGAPPHRGENVLDRIESAYLNKPRTFPPEVPEEIVKLCEKAMRRSPSERFASVDELHRGVRDFLQHKASRQLAQRAELSAKELTELLARTGNENLAASDVEVHGLFVESRFGYRQALLAWPGNDAATQGLQGLLCTMIELELQRNNPRSAMALLSQLPKPRADLAARIETAAREEKEREARFHDLERLQRDVDVHADQEIRAGFVLLVTIFWVVALFVVGWLGRTGRWLIGTREAFFTNIVYAVMLMVTGYWFSRSRQLNEAQRKLIRANYLGAGSNLLHWGMSWYLGVSFHSALIYYALFSAGQFLQLAIFFDRRMWITGALFLLCALSLRVVEHWQIEALAITVGLGFGWVAWIWRENAKLAAKELS